MHTEMWEHPATVANVATLRARGAIVIEPAVGRLTGADTGKGRLPEPAEIFAVAARSWPRRRWAVPDLAGRHVVVTAGGTREPLDPVRFLGNRSSGKQGYAFARDRRGPGRPGDADRRERRRCPIRPASRWSGSAPPRSCATATLEAAAERRRRGDGRRARPTSGRPTYQHRRSRSATDGSAPVIELAVNPDIAAELGAASGPARCWSRSRRRRTTRSRNARGKLAPQAGRPDRGQRGRRRQGVRHTTTTRRPCSAPTDRPPTSAYAAKEDLADAVWDWWSPGCRRQPGPMPVTSGEPAHVTWLVTLWRDESHAAVAYGQ